MRQFFVDRAIAGGDTERAIALLEETTTNASGRYPIDAVIQLLALYEQTERVDGAAASSSSWQPAMHRGKASMGSLGSAS